MPLLDICHLFFEPAATVEDDASIFGKEWRVTLDYVLHQPGLESSYTSRISAENNMWVFLLWKTEENRTNFYHQTPGFGFVIQHMAKAPHVFFFGDASYDELDETSSWTIDVLCAQTIDESDSKVPKAPEQENHLHKDHVAALRGSHAFLALQARKAFEILYQGNDFDNAYVGLIRSDSRTQSIPESILKRAEYSVELQRRDSSIYTSCAQTKVAVDIADLTKKQPWEYGVLGYDDSDYADTAYPMSLSFRPMMTLASAGKFLPDTGYQLSEQSDDDKEYVICLLDLSAETDILFQDSKDTIANLRKEVGLQNGVQGLRELSILRTLDTQPENRRSRLLCVWDTISDFLLWRDILTEHSHRSLELSWTSHEAGMSKLDWGNMPLTPDYQSWQQVDKILETVKFAFAPALSPPEKQAFQQILSAFVDKMSSCWSGDIDAAPVIHAEDPIWTQNEDGSCVCLLFLAWDGTAQRTAWFRNFMADDFILTGHLAYILGRVCRGVESGTYTSEKVYECQMTQDARPDKEHISALDNDSDQDMGF